mmetsp:Transcript_12273/g.19464  ORF Transcript_12273/g.19464 Transcript_12273/m.19464 type:complete len:107 (-) Transcript_12273:294-614(-)
MGLPSSCGLLLGLSKGMDNRSGVGNEGAGEGASSETALSPMQSPATEPPDRTVYLGGAACGVGSPWDDATPLAEPHESASAPARSAARDSSHTDRGNGSYKQHCSK